jgi:3-(3-hydroxy-phenyl)propionate hydroxylase
VHEFPRALALDHEVMRVFQQLGVVPAIAPHVEPFTPSEYYGVEGQLIRRMTMLAPPYPQGYTPSLVFNQPPVERALRDRIAQLPNVSVHLGRELRELEAADGGVTLQLTTQAGEQEQVRARWAIGCDGAASTVRERLGIALEDLHFDEPWLVVDVKVTERALQKLPQVSVQYCEPARPCSFLIGPGNHRRWEISLARGEDLRALATPERTWQLLARWLMPEDGALWRQASYRFHALVVERWREGRVFLAGDAAHMQPPFLGQGMCQGIRDVVNLVWKLGAVLRGEVSGAAAERLLDTYGRERSAHVSELIRRIKAIGALICERDPLKARERDAQLLAECGGVVKDTPRQDVLPRLEVGLLASEPGSGRGTLFPQPRLAHASGEAVLMDDRLGYGWRLVSDGSLRVPAAVSGARSLVLDSCVWRETEGVVAAWMRRHACHAALVRPDHYVYGTAATQDELARLLGQWRTALN